VAYRVFNKKFETVEPKVIELANLPIGASSAPLGPMIQEAAAEDEAKPINEIIQVVVEETK